MPTHNKNGDLRQPAETRFAEELDALIKAEKHSVPAGWRMSPRSVLTYICGGKCGKLDITPKYIGHQRLVEIAISTLVTDRALLFQSACYLPPADLPKLDAFAAKLDEKFVDKYLEALAPLRTVNQTNQENDRKI